MGFFGDILKGGLKLLGIGGGAPVRPALAAAGTARLRGTMPAGTRGAVGRIVRGGAIAAGAGAAFELGGAAVRDESGALVAMGGGNGVTSRRTIVQTIENATGEVIKQVVKEGAPHLMNKDLQIAKRVFRLSSKLHARMPKRTVRMSRTKMLTTQVVENALERASCPPAPCPTK